MWPIHFPSCKPGEDMFNLQISQLDFLWPSVHQHPTPCGLWHHCVQDRSAWEVHFVYTVMQAPSQHSAPRRVTQSISLHQCYWYEYLAAYHDTVFWHTNSMKIFVGSTFFGKAICMYSWDIHLEIVSCTALESSNTKRVKIVLLKNLAPYSILQPIFWQCNDSENINTVKGFTLWYRQTLLLSRQWVSLTKHPWITSGVDNPFQITMNQSYSKNPQWNN